MATLNTEKPETKEKKQSNTHAINRTFQKHGN